MNEIEIFFKDHEHTVAALAAISTLAAVVVSLVVTYISQRSNRTRIKANVTVNLILHSSLEGKPQPEYICVSVTNLGIMPAAIQFAFFCWKLPFVRGSFLVNPLDFYGDDWFQKRTYPIEIKPRSSVMVCLSEMGVFREMCRNNLIGNTFVSRFRFRFLRAIVVTDDRRIFKVEIDRSLRKELRRLRDAVTETGGGK